LAQPPAEDVNFLDPHENRKKAVMCRRRELFERLEIVGTTPNKSQWLVNAVGWLETLAYRRASAVGSSPSACVRAAAGHELFLSIAVPESGAL
jgi:hypothetical protein